MIILKVRNYQGFTLSLKDTLLKKATGAIKLTPMHFRVKEKLNQTFEKIFAHKFLMTFLETENKF